MSNSSNEDEYLSELSANIVDSNNGNSSMLPEKSKEKYSLAYYNFIEWKNNKNEELFSEHVFMEYFTELAEKYKPSTLWCIYSMLKGTVMAKNGVDIKNYHKVLAFLKKYSGGFKSKKSSVLSAQDVQRFLQEAPDEKFLAIKVALIFGITGACSRQELTNITTKHIETHGKMYLVKIPTTKKKIPRSFTIHGKFYEIVKKYADLRSTKGECNRFFQKYQNGKCTRQPIGINKFGIMPKEIARFLGLPDADSYTGHSFRRTSATMLADLGPDIVTVNLGGWQSNTAAEFGIDIEVPKKEEEKVIPELNVSVDVKPKFEAIYSESGPFSHSNENSMSLPPNDENMDANSRPATPFETIENTEFSNQDNENIIKNLTQTITMPGRNITLHFHNCTFTNCFNK